MMKFECKDMEIDCDYVATAETQEEVLDLAMTHAVEAHADMFKDLTAEQTEEMNAKIESMIKEDDEEAVMEDDAEETVSEDAVSEEVVEEDVVEGAENESEAESEAEAESTEAA